MKIKVVIKSIYQRAFTKLPLGLLSGFSKEIYKQLTRITARIKNSNFLEVIML